MHYDDMKCLSVCVSRKMSTSSLESLISWPHHPARFALFGFYDNDDDYIDCGDVEDDGQKNDCGCTNDLKNGRHAGKLF